MEGTQFTSLRLVSTKLQYCSVFTVISAAAVPELSGGEIVITTKKAILVLNMIRLSDSYDGYNDAITKSPLLEDIKETQNPHLKIRSKICFMFEDLLPLLRCAFGL
ncbi:hypothetical protein KSP39_PZI003274 [Platanthera zijinensis]|uniref:Uncharacterized protein n=1 Tax=Platanthera zijinensis TaxID=2320716 RepID=A0AAP0GBT1_9ASPA